MKKKSIELKAAGMATQSTPTARNMVAGSRRPLEKSYPLWSIINLKPGWADELMTTHARCAVGPHFLDTGTRREAGQPSPSSSNRRRAWSPAESRIAALIRDFGHVKGWHEITLRDEAPNGKRSESEIIFDDELCNRFFYAHANRTRDCLPYWMLLDLIEVRRARAEGIIGESQADGELTLEIWPMKVPEIVIAWDASEQVLKDHIHPDMGPDRDGRWFRKRCKFRRWSRIVDPGPESSGSTLIDAFTDFSGVDDRQSNSDDRDGRAPE